MAKMNMLRNSIFLGGFVHIFVNGWAIRDRLFMQPWFEAISQSVHVGVRPDTGVTEQIPCTAHVGALLNNGVTLVRALHCEVRRSADAGQSSSYDQNIYSRLSLRHMPLHFMRKSY